MKTRNAGSVVSFVSILFTVLLLAGAPLLLHGQLVADGGTLNFTGATNLAGNLIVGTNGGNTMLNILAPGTVTNATGEIGLNATSTNNQVRVENSGAVWQNNGNLFVGYDGSGNQLVASNGGVMANISGYVGSGSNANNNRALVTGTGSLWTNSGNINLGYFGSGNQLVVSNGGTVQAVNTYVGYTGSISNLAVVSGAGSLWTNRFVFYLGVFGSGNQLVVSNGGVVANGDGFLGLEASSTNNLAVVSGAGSLWTNRGNFFLGSDGSGNRMVVTNGGTLQAIGVFVGLNAGSTNNRAIVDGGNLIVTNSGGSGTVDVRRGTNVLNAGLIQTDNLVLNNGAGFFDFNGGTLITHGGTVNNGQPFVVGASGTTAAIFDVRSNYDPLVVNNDFTLGANTATGNQLLLTNGGALRVTGTSYVGVDAAASNNLVTISGPDSLWTNSSEFYFGYFGSGNQLVVGDGGALADGFAYIGLASSSSNNVAVVTGAGSTWANTGDLRLGGFGSGNQLVVSDGGAVVSGTGYFAANSGESSNNLAMVTGPNSRWLLNSILNLGYLGGGNQLVVSNAGTVQAPNAYVGVNPSSTNNRVIVDGGSLIVTNSAGTAVLDIRRGTNVLNAGLIQTDNLLLNNGTGFFEFNGGTLITSESTVDNGSPLVVGNGSSPATLNLNGNGLHTFTDGLVISGAATLIGAATLTGNGTVAGQLTVQHGGYVMPGNSVGKLVLNNSPVLQGAVLMEISKTGATLTNDQIQVIAPLTYDGFLSVVNLGPTPLGNGDSFKLFDASSYAGIFLSPLVLPILPAGLMWTNQLLVNGTITVVPQTAPKISNVTQAGTNLVMNITGGPPGWSYELHSSTNVALPLLSWPVIKNGYFDWLGNLTLTNGINLAEPQRYFSVLAIPGGVPD